MKGQLGLWGCFYRNTTDPKQRCQSGRALLRSIKVQKLFYKVPNRGISALLPKLLHLLQWEQVTLRAQLQPTHTHVKTSNHKAPGIPNLSLPSLKDVCGGGLGTFFPFPDINSSLQDKGSCGCRDLEEAEGGYLPPLPFFPNSDAGNFSWVGDAHGGGALSLLLPVTY